MRMRWPSRVPALMRTSSGSVFVTVPSPWQVGQVVRFLPVPWQRGHCTLNFMRPPVCVICPVPLHSGHLPGASRKPWPWQVRADILARDVQAHHAAADRRPERNVDLIFEIGAGLRAFLRGAPPRRRRKFLPKMSRKLPPPPLPPLASPRWRCRPCQKNRSRRNRNGTPWPPSPEHPPGKPPGNPPRRRLPPPARA